MKHPGETSTRPRLAGTILIVTMWIVLVLASLVLVFSHTVKVEATAGANILSMRQAQAAAHGAIAIAKAVATQQIDPEDDIYEASQIGDTWMWIIRPDYEDDQVLDYGMIDLAGRLNINVAPIEMLMELPDMTAELAASIIDWRDGDDQVSPNGAESEYYLLLPEPYQCKNAPFESVEELLLVKGATLELLYGEDTNRNGILDPNENDGDDSAPDDDANGRLDRGLFPFITVHSREPNASTGDSQLLNINQAPNPELSQLLDDTVDGDRYFTIMQQLATGRPFTSIFDFYNRTSLERKEFDQIASRLTAVRQQNPTGLINVNTAPAVVLACLPGIDESEAAALVTQRGENENTSESITWILDVLDKEKAAAIGSLITSRSYQHAADIVTVAGNGRGFCRSYVIVDTTQQPPRILKHQDLTSLGWPLDRTIMTSLRQGEEMQDILRKVQR